MINQLKGTYGAPPLGVIHAALVAARQSPCQKSKRGAMVFHPFKGFIGLASWNSRPDGQCDGRCQFIGMDPPEPSVCSRMCLHAEARAIRYALTDGAIADLEENDGPAIEIAGCELVHVKVDAHGELVPSGGPSCWQCAKEIADVGLFGVWLYETVSFGNEGVEERWNFYPTQQFYDLTMKECRLV